MFYVTGDTHGSFSHIRRFARSRDLGTSDTIVSLGDTSLNYHGDERDDKAKRKLAALPFTLLSLRGNHDRNPLEVDGMETHPWNGGTVQCEPAYPNILYAVDGSVFDFEGLSVAAIGGAYSVDRGYRLENGYTWFADEQLDDEQKRTVEAALEARGWAVDCVLTHTCPKKYLPHEALFDTIDQSTVDDSTEAWLDILEERLTYRRWYCGHFHIDKTVDRMRFLYRTIEALSV
ncbi:metallophosphoesterase [Raoultibacter phocaeensis]|uniref:metallophosphoesterase n=1 Tax=Raoultibacter phocaeensis TaxID=2479841 RepID=UPI001118A575|nr:metallophosphoesterase family protein [Raoultibacter phocaeensis]